jgi:hypothetical protein
MNGPPDKDALKDHLIHLQGRENEYLGAAASGFAAELLARDWIPNRSAWKTPVIFASSAVALVGILGDLYYGFKRRDAQRQLNAATSLATPELRDCWTCAAEQPKGEGQGR